MKTFTLAIAMLLLSSLGLFAQSGLKIESRGTVTVNGNLVITFPCGQPSTDSRDGKIYSTVQIGTQCWFAQNLNVGTKILGSANQTNNGIIEKYCWGNNEANCTVYGGLYQWDEAMQYSTTEGVQGICPPNWHLPSDAEWYTLTTFLGGESIAGGKLKESGLSHWLAPNYGATNSSGFTALPGGYSVGFESFVSLGYYGQYWSSSQNALTTSWCRGFDYNGEYVGRTASTKMLSFSVRCLKD